MTMTNADKQRQYRKRKAGGLVPIKPTNFKPMTAVERMRKFRERHPGIDGKRRLEIKFTVLSHYGNGQCACVQCGENRMACLSIDHIQGGGNRQRIGRLRVSDCFYRWLQNENYPEGYQTLCMNCQFVKRFDRGEHN